MPKSSPNWRWTALPSSSLRNRRFIRSCEMWRWNQITSIMTWLCKCTSATLLNIGLVTKVATYQIGNVQNVNLSHSVYILNQLTLPFPLWYPSKKVRNFKVLSRIELILHYDLKKATYLMYPIRTRFLNPFFQREVLFDSYSTRKIYISFKAFLTYNLLKIEMW